MRTVQIERLHGDVVQATGLETRLLANFPKRGVLELLSCRLPIAHSRETGLPKRLQSVLACRVRDALCGFASGDASLELARGDEDFDDCEPAVIALSAALLTRGRHAPVAHCCHGR